MEVCKSKVTYVLGFLGQFSREGKKHRVECASVIWYNYYWLLETVVHDSSED